MRAITDRLKRKLPVCIAMDIVLHDKLEAIAYDKGMSISGYVCSVLEKKVEGFSPTNRPLIKNVRLEKGPLVNE